MERHYSGVEVRASGRTLEGPALVYGDTSPSHRERFERGAFDLDGTTRWLDYRHRREVALAWTNGGGLTISNTPQALMVRAELPAIPAADRTLEELRSGKLTGLSIEFRPLKERREGNIRVVEKAELRGIGVVGSPSYPQSTVEVRARSGRTMRATVPSGKTLACKCSGKQCHYAKFKDDALEEMWDRANDPVAGFGSYSESPLASVSRGTLRGRMNRGNLDLEIDIPEGAVGAATIAAHEAAGVIVRPALDADLSDWEIVAGTAIYTRATLRGVVVSATDQREGWPSPEIVATADDLMETREGKIITSTTRRRRIWL